MFNRSGRRGRASFSIQPAVFEPMERRVMLSAVAGIRAVPVRMPLAAIGRTAVPVARRPAFAPPYIGTDEALSAGGIGPKFVTGTTKWNSPNLTYSYSNLLDGGLPGGLTADQLRSLTQEALMTWAAVSPVTFTERPDSGPPASDTGYDAGSTPQIRVGHHPFDAASGGLNVLAHGYFPANGNLGVGLGGDLHFNDSLKFVAGKSGPAGFGFLETAVHEIGHNLGLQHANGDVTNGTCPPAKPAIMDACLMNRYDGPGTAFLFPDDVAGVQSLYGAGLGWLKDLAGNLYVDGTQGDDAFTLSATGSSLTVASAGVGSFTRDVSDVSNVVLLGRGGNDRVDVLGLPAGVGLTVDAGAGNDAITVKAISPADSPVVIDGGTGLDAVVANDRVRFATSQDLSSLTIGGGGRVALAAGGGRVITTRALSINAAAGGTLDLADNSLIVDYAGQTVLPAVGSLIASAYNGGAWTGAGLTSSTAAAVPGRALGFGEASSILGPAGGTFAGRAIDGSAVLVRSTNFGDANLDGRVNLADFGRLRAAFGRTAARWADGDFNYDGAVRGDDFSALLARFGTNVPIVAPVPLT